MEIELMGTGFSGIGYHIYAVSMDLGTGDLNKIGIIAENLSDHIVKYRLPDNS